MFTKKATIKKLCYYQLENNDFDSIYVCTLLDEKLFFGYANYEWHMLDIDQQGREVDYTHMLDRTILRVDEFLDSDDVSQVLVRYKGYWLNEKRYI